MACDGIVPGPGPRDGWQRSLPVLTQGPGALFTICGPCAKYRRDWDSATAQGRRGAPSSCKPGHFPFFLFTSICSHQSPFPRDESVLRSGLSFILSRLSAPTHLSGAVVCLWLNHTCLFLLTSPADPWLQNNRPKVGGYRRKGGRVRSGIFTWTANIVKWKEIINRCLRAEWRWWRLGQPPKWHPTKACCGQVMICRHIKNTGPSICSLIKVVLLLQMCGWASGREQVARSDSKFKPEQRKKLAVKLSV